MHRYTIKLSAAVFFSLIAATACSQPGSNPGAADTPATAQGAEALKAPDPLLIAADRGRIAGDSTARTWVVIASDFQCPYCRQWHAESYKPFIDEYVRTGKVRVAFLNFPLGQHRNAIPTASAAMCAGVQGKFWQYHDAVFETQAKWSAMSDVRPVLDSIAQRVGVDVPQWAKCFESDAMLPLILADRDRASKGGVQSTPSFLIGGQVMAGAIPFAEMRPVIDSVIARDRRASGAQQ